MRVPLVVGCTRPAMIAGVSGEAFLGQATVSVLAFLASNELFMIFLFIPLHLVNMAICRFDPRLYELVLLWARTTGRAGMRRHWRGSSYSPWPKAENKRGRS